MTTLPHTPKVMNCSASQGKIQQGSFPMPYELYKRVVAPRTNRSLMLHGHVSNFMGDHEVEDDHQFVVPCMTQIPVVISVAPQNHCALVTDRVRWLPPKNYKLWKQEIYIISYLDKSRCVKAVVYRLLMRSFEAASKLFEQFLSDLQFISSQPSLVIISGLQLQVHLCQSSHA